MKLVIETSLYYGARSEKHTKTWVLCWKHIAFRPCPLPDESNYPLAETHFIILYSYEGIRHSPGQVQYFVTC